MNTAEAARDARERLAAAGVPDAAFEAELLVRTAAGLTRAQFFAGRPFPDDARGELEALLTRRLQREPAAHLIGVREFYELAFEVGRDVLVPRPETELLVELALAEARSGEVIIDVGTGSGAIAVATARHLAGRAMVTATDVSPAALAYARRNARRNGANVAFARADLLAPFARADIVLANLPYIPAGEIDQLEPEVSRWEPRVALDGGADGFALIRRLVADCGERLRPRLLALEVGYGQAAEVARIVAAAGFAVELVPDLAGIDRLVVGRWTSG